MRRIETDGEILQATIRECNETDNAARRVGERSQTSLRVLWQFSQKSFIIPHPSESRVTNQPPCTLYNVRAVFMMALLLQ